jgi:polyhydroxyalkanoate synthase subunit PhaC
MNSWTNTREEAPRPVGLLPAALEFSNILLTTSDAEIGRTTKDVVWTHRNTTLYRYRSDERSEGIPIVLVFALINRPDIFDLRTGNSLVEFLLGEGFDVYLLDWGVPDEADADTGLDYYVCDALPWAIREVLRSSGAAEVTLAGWCIGGTVCAAYCALQPDGPVRNLVLLTTPVDGRKSLYATWLNQLDIDGVAATAPVIPGRLIDEGNKLMKPVTNYWTTYRRLWQGVLDGAPRRDAYQAMAKWVGDNPPFPARAWNEWATWMYTKGELVRGEAALRGRTVDLRSIRQSLLVVTADQDHITPPGNTAPLFDLVASTDVTHLDRPGGHIGLIAGSNARRRIWPAIADWLHERSDPLDTSRRTTHGHS